MREGGRPPALADFLQTVSDRRRSGRGIDHAGVFLLHRRDSDESAWSSKAPAQPTERLDRDDHFTIVTGVPVLTDLKKFSAMNSGIRMQPCEAGYPGRYPACIPTPPTMRMKYGMGAPL